MGKYADVLSKIDGEFLPEIQNSSYRKAYKMKALTHAKQKATN